MAKREGKSGTEKEIKRHIQMEIVGQVDGAECKKDENKGEGLYTVYLSYLLPPAMSPGRET